VGDACSACSVFSQLAEAVRSTQSLTIRSFVARLPRHVVDSRRESPGGPTDPLLVSFLLFFFLFSSRSPFPRRIILYPAPALLPPLLLLSIINDTRHTQVREILNTVAHLRRLARQAGPSEKERERERERERARARESEREREREKEREEGGGGLGAEGAGAPRRGSPPGPFFPGPAERRRSEARRKGGRDAAAAAAAAAGVGQRQTQGPGGWQPPSPHPRPRPPPLPVGLTAAAVRPTNL